MNDSVLNGCISIRDLFSLAGGLSTEVPGENEEYDRALAELCCDASGVSMDDKEHVLSRIREFGDREVPGPAADGHTPGPWHTSKDAVPEGFTQVTVSADDGERVATVFRTEANARLISAAPDLLAAASLIVSSAIYSPDPRMKNTTDCYIVNLDDVDALRAAIEKATGEHE